MTTRGRLDGRVARQRGRRSLKASAPVRTCVGCRRARAKSELMRLVRSEDGTVRADAPGTAPGRGAYLCDDATCLDRAWKSGRFAHAFRKPCSAGPGLAEEVRRLWQQRRSR